MAVPPNGPEAGRQNHRTPDRLFAVVLLTVSDSRSNLLLLSRLTVCVMQGFDEYMNLVLDEAEEVHTKKGHRKQLGAAVIWLVLLCNSKLLRLSFKACTVCCLQVEFY